VGTDLVGVDLPVWGSVQVAALGITVLGLLLVFVARWSSLRTLGVCALVGIVVGLLGAAS
jgi:chromate transporter